MKAFVIWQPWASLVMVHAKPNEFRKSSYLDRRCYRAPPAPGDRVVVCAAARPVRQAEVEDLLERLDDPDGTTGLVPDLARPLLQRVLAAHKCRLLPTACGLGTVTIGEPISAFEIYGRTDSDRGAFNWAWPMRDPQGFEVPIPARGQQGFYEWPHEENRR